METYGYPRTLSLHPVLRGSHFLFTLPDGGVHEIVGPSEKRRVLIFSTTPQSGTVQFAPVNFTLGTQIGFTTQPNMALVIFRYEDFGSLVQGSWFATSNAGPLGICVTECFEE